MSSSPTDRWPPDEPALQRGVPRAAARPAFRAELRGALMSAPPTPPASPVAPVALLVVIAALVVGGWQLVARHIGDEAVLAPPPATVGEARDEARSDEGAPSAKDPASPAQVRENIVRTVPDRALRPMTAPTAEPTVPAMAPPPAVPPDAVAPVEALPVLPAPTEAPAAAPPPTEKRARRRAEPAPSATPLPTDAPVVLPATPTPRWTDAPATAPPETPSTPATPEPTTPPSP